jgi:diguanylate cyclase (GGDEF)-like protein/PAS domain S-box-containing protein
MKQATLESILSHKMTALKIADTIARALEMMTDHAISSVVITDSENRPIGIFTEHDALKVVAGAMETSVELGEVMTLNPFCVVQTMQMHDAYALMEEKHFRHLIVVDEEERFVGVVTEGDFLRHIGLEHLTKFKTVAEAMSESPLIVELKTTLVEAAALMNERKSDYAIVLNGATPIGVITERDIAHRCARDSHVSEEQVENLVHTDILIIGKEIALHHAASLMEEHGVHQLIVVDAHGNLSGILRRHDVLHAVHGAYFEYLIRVIDEKSAAIERISERKRELRSEKEELEKSALKFQKLFEAIPDGVVLLDTVTMKAVEFNRAVHEHLEYSAEEFAQLSIRDYNAVESLLEVRRRIEAISLNGHDAFETIHRTKSGKLMDVWVSVVAIELGAHSYMIAVYRDVSENKMREKLLQERQQILAVQTNFLKSLFDSIPDLIWLKDIDGTYITCNPMFERFFGAIESDIVGKTDFDFVDAELAQFFRNNDLAAIKAGGSRSNDEYLKFSDGSYEGYFETIKTPIWDVEGNAFGVLGIARDISERKRKDDEIMQVQALSHIGTWEWNVTKDEFIGSKESYRMFGMPEGKTVSLEEVLLRVIPEDRLWFEQEMMRASLEGTIQSKVIRTVDVNNAIRWVQADGSFIYKKDGKADKAVGILQDITERKLHEKQLETLANYDPLTGLANRSLLQSHLQNSIFQAKRHKTQIALVMFDLDRFKDINDSYGHSAGDELLQQVAQRFSTRLRDGDIISRLGGDEFAVIIDNLARPEDAGRLAEEMIATLESGYKLSSGVSIHIGASAGIVLCPDHGESASELMQHADAALYKAKSEGRGRYRYYTDELTDSARHRIECETRLRYAIKNEEFEVYYQPQVHIQTGRIVGAEALIRWNDPIRGIVSPLEFIPIAEETGLIGEIGEWVLNETCRQGKIWFDQGHRLTLAVNLSAHQVRHQNIPEMVENALKKSGYPANRLELELTESALMQREEETVEMLHNLRAHGIRLAIDDFGTGYSSLSYLKRFPIDVLKIDKSFVDDIPFDKDDMAIVTAIIAMAHALGFQVLAEGTERIEQIEFLKEKGCTMYQGYFKSQPVPAEEFIKLLK